MSITDVPSPAHLGPESNGRLMTPQEFDAVEEWDEDYRYELVHGVLIVTPPPGTGERKPNDVLGHWLLNYQESHPQGGALDDTLPEHTIATPTSRRRTDRAIWAGLGRVPDYEREIPTLVVEFVSRSSRDRKRDYLEKRQEYADAGVREFWVIDRFRRTMTVFRGTDEKIVVRETETYTTELLPGFELPLSRVLEVADRCTARNE